MNFTGIVCVVVVSCTIEACQYQPYISSSRFFYSQHFQETYCKNGRKEPHSKSICGFYYTHFIHRNKNVLPSLNYKTVKASWSKIKLILICIFLQVIISNTNYPSQTIKKHVFLTERYARGSNTMCFWQSDMLMEVTLCVSDRQGDTLLEVANITDGHKHSWMWQLHLCPSDMATVL